MTSDELFRYASRYADRAEKAGRGTQWPTLRQAKRRFRGATHQDFEDACANYRGEDALEAKHYACNFSQLGAAEIWPAMLAAASDKERR